MWSHELGKEPESLPNKSELDLGYLTLCHLSEDVEPEWTVYRGRRRKNKPKNSTPRFQKTVPWSKPSIKTKVRDFHIPLQNGFLSLDSVEDTRKDRSSRKLVMRVDSGACTSVIEKDEIACRGYKRWKDQKYGREYSTAAKEKVRELNGGMDPQGFQSNFEPELQT